MLKATEKRRQITWYILLIVSLIALIIMWLDTYLFDTNKRYMDDDGEIIGKKWYDELILPFYFTHISNVMGFLMAFNWVFLIIKNNHIRKRFEILTVTNLMLTLLVYWTILLPFGPPQTALGWIDNLLVHLFVPLLGLFAFLNENFFIKNKIKFKTWKDSGYHMIFPIVWLIIAMIIYISLNFDSGAAIYPFLDVVNNPVWLSIIYFLAIGICYYFITWFFIKITNK